MEHPAASIRKLSAHLLWLSSPDMILLNPHPYGKIGSHKKEQKKEASVRTPALIIVAATAVMVHQSPCFAERWAWVSSGHLNGVSNVFRLIQGTDGALYAGTSPNGEVLKSTDGGAYWYHTADLAGARSVFGLFCAADGAVYAGTAPNGAVFKTMDGGGGWIKAAAFADATEVKSFAETSEAVLYAGTGPHGKIYKSSDAGATWLSTAELSGVRYVYSLLAASDGAIYAGTDGYVFKTTDGGESWQNTADVTAAEYVFSLLHAADGSVYAGGAGSVFKTTDGGANWISLGRLSAQSYAVFALVQDVNGAIYATSGSDGGIYMLGNSGWLKVATLTKARNVYALLRSREGNVCASGQGVILTYAPLLALKVSSSSLSIGEPFAVEVTVERIARSFDAYCVITGLGGTYSFAPGAPAHLTPGIQPLVRGVPGLKNTLSRFRFAIPEMPADMAPGGYTVIAGLVPQGRTPTGERSAFPGYLDDEEIVVEGPLQEK
jgi:photosystem II stability/assembly factor-like uncharacterized protein